MMAPAIRTARSKSRNKATRSIKTVKTAAHVRKTPPSDGVTSLSNP